MIVSPACSNMADRKDTAVTGTQSDSDAKRLRNDRRATWMVWLILLAVAIGLLAGRYADPWLKRNVLLKEVAFSGVHGDEPMAVQFSPDNQTIAYLHHTTRALGGRFHAAEARTLSDAVDLRWRPTKGDGPERSVVIDTIDLGPDGMVGRSVEARFRFSPDSSRIAVVCARQLIIMDAVTGEKRSFHFESNWPCDVAWVSADDVLLVTDDSLAWTFQLWCVGEPTSSRKIIHKEAYRQADAGPIAAEQRRPELTGRFEFSPSGKSVLFRRILGRQMEVLLDVDTSRVTQLMRYRGSHSWNADGTALLICGSNEDDDGELGSVVLLVDLRNGEVRNLDAEATAAFGEEAMVSVTASRWMPDGEHVLIRSIVPAYQTEDRAVVPAVVKDHLVRVDPWDVVMTRDEMLYWSPVSYAVLIGDEDGLAWLGYDSEDLGNLGDGVDWIWSPDCYTAARVDDGKVVVFDTTVSPRGP
jgi:hypothetical protein